MVSNETLREQFDELGCDPSDNIIEKCIEICNMNNIDDPVEFVERWMTFSIAKFNGAEPTNEYLEIFEKSELQHSKQPIRDKISRENIEGKRMKIQNDSDEDENDILGAYITVTPKPQKKSVSRLHQTPEVTKSASKIVTSEKSGNVVYSFGNFTSALEEFIPSKSVNIKMADLDDGTQWIEEKSRYLTANMQNDGPLITHKMFELGKDISKKILGDKNEQVQLNHCDEISQNPILCLGKIIITEGKKANSIMFIQFDETKSRHVQLDLSRINQAQIFSGQVCIIEGTNPRGNLFYPTEIFYERILEIPQVPSMTSSLQVMIASGPFTDKDDFLFEYLDQLLLVCKNNKPNLLILSGAFIDRKSSKIGDLMDDVEDIFNSLLTKISEEVGNDTKVVIVSSSNDLNSSISYPTPSYKFAKLRNFSNIFFAPDPSIIDVNGIKIGITSVDVQSHFSDNEFCMNASADKIRRYVNNIFHQKSFYPIFPYGMPASIEHLHEYANLNKIPNIMILPSDLKYYIRDINGCLCVNPGHSYESGKLGTFARLVIQSPKDEKSKFISGQVVNL